MPAFECEEVYFIIAQLSQLNFINNDHVLRHSIEVGEREQRMEDVLVEIGRKISMLLSKILLIPCSKHDSERGMHLE